MFGCTVESKCATTSPKSPPLLSDFFSKTKIPIFFKSSHYSRNLSTVTATTFNAGDLRFSIVFNF